MVYKKYIKRNGKVFGPYYYESKRVNGRVVNSYVSREKAKERLAQINDSNSFIKTCKVTLLVLTVLGIVGIGIFIFTNQISLTGRVSYNSELIRHYNLGENISGNLILKVKEGELVPADAKLVVELEENKIEKAISELAIIPESEGDFYIEGASLGGSGIGYGLVGRKVVYPYVEFELRIVEKEGKSKGEKSSSESDEEIAGEVRETENSDEAIVREEPGSGENFEAANEPESEINGIIEDSEETIGVNEESSGEGGSLITGNVISEQAEIGEIIHGSVKSGENFVYNLEEGQSVELVSGSVKVNGEYIGDENVNVKVNPKKVRVTTNYYIVEEGYGEGYLGTESIEFLKVNLSEMEIPAQDGILRISLVYDNEEAFSIEDEINVISTVNESIRQEGNDTIINESYEEGYEDSEEVEKSEEYGGIVVLRMIKEIPQIQILKDSSFDLNLSEYFEGAVGYNASADSLDIVFDGEIMTITPKSGFSGKINMKITAYGLYGSVESNEFKVSVLSSESRIVTLREEIRLNKPVKWVKNISLAIPESVTIELPAQAYNISVKKIEREKPEEIEADYYLVTGKIIAGEDYSFDKDRFSIFELVARFFRTITGVVIGEEGIDEPSEQKIEVVLDEGAENYIVEYYTEAPTSLEIESPKGKRVVISGPDELDYKDVVSFADIPEIVDVGKENMIRVFWVDEGKDVQFEAYDSDRNGKLDYVEWVVPHLSNQTFEIILITNAEHLDENRDFVENVYELVKERDNLFVEIPDSHYLRVRFEREVNSSKDITIYARSSDYGNVVVYEKDGDEIIANFGEINEDREYRVYLTNLSGEQDTFDLKVYGNVEFDYVVDPVFYDFVETQSCMAEDFDAQGSFPRICDYITGYSLLYDDSTYETHIFGKQKNQFAGVRVEYYDRTINTCTNITNVTLCYEWWVTDAPSDCDVSISTNNGTNWTAITTICPGTTAEPGVICVDISGLRNWSCNNFFGENATGVLLKSELTRQTSGPPITEIATWDVLSIKVNYTLSSKPPRWSNPIAYPASPVVYSPNLIPQFNVTWTDDYNVESVEIEHDFSGTMQNYSVSNLSSVYYYSYGSLGVGNYRWRMYAKDVDNQYNYTDYYNYSIVKNTSIISLYLNGAQFNKTIYENNTVNISALLDNPLGGYVYLYLNNSLVNESNSPVYYTTLSSLGEGVYNVTAIYLGNNNYTSASKTYYLIVRSGADSEPPIVNVVYPAYNQTIRGEITLNVTTDESGYCRYSTTKNFPYLSGTLFDVTGTQIHSTNLGILGDGSYSYYIKCNDSRGNINTVANQGNISFIADNTPPRGVTNLNAVTRDYTSIYWSWTNPTNADFNKSIVYINDINLINISFNYYNATGLEPSTTYIIKIFTEDNVGNINLTEIVNVSSTLTDDAPVISSISASPDPYYGVGSMNFSANVSDDFNVTFVTLSIGENLFDMIKRGDGLYHYEWNNPPKTSGIYEYIVRAYDRFRQSNSTSYFSVVSSAAINYVEHDSSMVFNEIEHYGILQQKNFSFAKGAESLGWNFTKENAEDYGGLIIDNHLIIFGGMFGVYSKQDAEAVYLRWELVDVNATSGSEKVICSTPNLTGGALVLLGMNVYSGTCTPSSQYYVTPGNKLRVKIYGYNPSSQARVVGHAWDTISSASEYIISQIEVGNYSVSIKEPSSDVSVELREEFNFMCSAECVGGYCFDMNSWIEYYNGSWKNVSYSSLEIVHLNESSANPAGIGTISNSSNSSYRLYGNIGDINVTLRCMMMDRYKKPIYSNNRTIHIIGIDAPNVSLIAPANGYVENRTNNVNFSCEARDKNGLRNITLYWDYGGTWLKSESVNASGKFNSTIFKKVGLSNGNITWNCYACDKFNNCSFARENWTTTIDYSAAPIIRYISAIPNLSPIEGGFTNVVFNTEVYSQLGVDKINHTSIEFNISKGSTSIIGNCAYLGNIDSYSANYSCIGNMWYFYEPGTWSVSVRGRLIGGEDYGYNSSGSFVYYQLISISSNTTGIDFGEIGANESNKAALNPFDVANIGNANLGAEINASELYGNIDSEDKIEPSNFSTSGILGKECFGRYLIKGDFADIPDFFLDFGNSSEGKANSALGFCIPIAPKVPAQNYSTSENEKWVVRVFSV